MGKAIDITGEEFGRLKAIRKIGKNNAGRSIWELECSCDNKTIAKVSLVNLRKQKGGVKSCGCLRSERTTTTSFSGYGMTKSATEWIRWARKNKQVDISINVFLRRIKLGHSVEKIFEIGKYEPNLYEGFGMNKTPCEWIKYAKEEFGIDIDTQKFFGRLRVGWNVEDIVSKPVRSVKTIEAFDMEKTGREWCEWTLKENGIDISYGAFMKRINSGVDPEEALTTPVYKRPIKNRSQEESGY